MLELLAFDLVVRDGDAAGLAGGDPGTVASPDSELRPERDAGRIVVCDRYVASSLVLQQMDGVHLEFVEAINVHADRPDLAVILTAEPSVTAARVAHRGTHDRFHAGVDTSTRETDLYREISERLVARGYPIVTVDTSGASPDQVARHIGDHVAALVDVPGSNSATA